MRRFNNLKLFCIALALTTAGSSPVQAQTGSEAPDGVEKAKLDVSYIPPSAVGAVAVYPRSVLLSKDMEFVPREILSAISLRDYGIDPVDVEQVLVVVEPPAAGIPGGAVVAHFAKPFDKDKLLPMLKAQTADADLGGKPYRKGNNPLAASIFAADDRTLIVGSDETLKKVVASHAAPQEGKVSAMLSHVGTPDIVAIVNIEALRPAIAGGPAQLPPPFSSLVKVPELVQYAAIKLDLTGDMTAALMIRANDEEAAQQVEAVIDGVLAFAKPMAMQQAMLQAQNMPGDDEMKKAQAQYTRRVCDRMFELYKPVRKGATLSLSGNLRDSAPMLTASVIPGLLLPAIQAGRDAGRRTISSNNLRQICLAANNYNSTYNAMPPRAIFKDGKPLLSWRVMMLPYLEEDALYKQFKLDEPWNSPHNMALIPKMPKCYANPALNMPQSGKTPYLGVSGKGLLFDGDKGRKMAEIVDGTANTIMFVEVKPEREVVWTKPDDWEFNEQQPMDGLGAQPNGFNAAFADGAVRFISFTIDAKMLKALFTIAGGEQVPLNF